MGARETQSGDEAEEESGDERERNREAEDGQVNADDRLLGKGAGRQLHGQFREPVRCGDTEDCAGDRYDDGFYEQLTDDAPAAGAEGGAPGEQKDGAVGAADDEQQQYT